MVRKIASLKMHCLMESVLTVFALNLECDRETQFTTYTLVYANSIIMTRDHMMLHLCAMHHYRRRQYKLTPS